MSEPEERVVALMVMSLVAFTFGLAMLTACIITVIGHAFEVNRLTVAALMAGAAAASGLYMRHLSGRAEALNEAYGVVDDVR